MSQENVNAVRYGARAFDFVRSASVLCKEIHDGWLPSACLLLGFACELLAKRRLLHEGIAEEVLRKPPFGHDISGMWRNNTQLFEEAESLVLKFKQNPNSNGVDEMFDWGLHFDHLAHGHSQKGDYSLRYHNGEIHFADPKAVTVVLAQICLEEQRKSFNWAT